MKQSQIGPSLSRIVKCQVSWDKHVRDFYSVDASSYRLKPQVVAFPHDESDVVKIVKFAKKNRIQITPRGAGTGLVGSALGSGIILDMRHFDKIKLGKNHVSVESGVFKGNLDKKLKEQNRFIGPDPSIGPYCTIGGMIGTNASGVHSLKYGSVIDNLIQVRIVNSAGDIIEFPGKKNSKIIKTIHSGSISFPKVSKNSCGYRIDKILAEKDLHKLFAGSEGTLGIITCAKFKTYASPKNTFLCIIHYDRIIQAARDVPKILELRPSAIELVDKNITRHIKIKTPNTGCLLFVEFDENIQSCSKKIHDVIQGKIIKKELDKNKIKKLWNFRNSALAYSLQSIAKNETMPTLIEDAVVPVKRLPLLLEMIEVISKKHGLRLVTYGHAGNGNLHMRPILRQKDMRLVRKIAAEFFAGVISIGGSITGEHGDGLARSEFVKMQYDKNTNLVFRQIKKQLDPENILNPGKIISTKSTVTRNLKI